MLFIVNRCSLRTVFEMTCCRKGNWKQAALYLRDGQLYSWIKIDPTCGLLRGEEDGVSSDRICCIVYIETLCWNREKQKSGWSLKSSGAWPDDKSNYSTLEHGHLNYTWETMYSYLMFRKKIISRKHWEYGTLTMTSRKYKYKPEWVKSRVLSSCW